MQSEIGILRSQGLKPKPENTTPAPPDATVAGRHYGTTVEQFNQLVAKIDSYSSQASRSDIGAAVLRLIDQARRLANDVRHRADELGSYPTCFITLNSGIVYFSDIAAAAAQAYHSRISGLEDLESALGKTNAPKYKIIDLEAHNKQGGHLQSRHVAQSMTDFQKRFLEEEERGRPKRKLSSLTAQAAQEVVSRAMHLGKKQLEQANEGQKIFITISELTDIGYVKERGTIPKLVKSGRLLVIKDSNHPDGFRIITAELDNE